jgi:Flp pilus assembly protein TadD
MERITTLNNDGIAFTEAGQLDKAIEAFDEALGLEPENAALWFNLGIAIRKAGDKVEAADCFHKALTLDRENCDAWNNLGLIHYEEKSPEMAEICYKNALKYCGQEDAVAEAAVWNNLGVLSYEAGDYAEAVTRFGHAVELNPDFVDAALNLQDAEDALRGDVP